MTRDEILRLAREAGVMPLEHFYVTDVFLQRFVHLVEQRLIRDGYRQCAKGQRTTQFCGLLDAAVKAEREACVELCLEHSKLNVDDANAEFSHLASYEFGKQVGAATCATAIKARGEI